MRVQWIIKEYETSRGECPVSEFIKKQKTSVIAKTTHLIDLLQLYGSLLGMPHARKLHVNLYELRIRGKEEIRILYGFKDMNIYLLHAFKKQSQKTPQKDIALASKRYFLLDKT